MTNQNKKTLENLQRRLNYHSQISLTFPLLLGAAECYANSKHFHKSTYLEMARPIYDSIRKSQRDFNNDPLVEAILITMEKLYPNLFIELKSSYDVLGEKK
jgi:hypothetical protein